MDKLAHRRGSVVFEITDAAGRPYAGKNVRAELTKSAFMWGCGNFEAEDYCNPGPDTDVEHYRVMMEEWLKLFGFATLPFYWGRFEPIEGEPHTERIMKTALYLKEKGIRLKGHPLCWHTNSAEWLLKYDNKTIMDKQLERIYREVGDFRGVVDMWDVINETVIMPVFDRYDNPVTRICNAYGRINLIREVFAAARAANPNATLVINDFNTSPAYEAVLEEALSAGISIDVIGIQSHQHQGYWGDEKLYDVLSRFSRFGLPIHFTENTLTSGHLMPPEIVDLNDYVVDRWPSEPALEIRQAELTERMYRILFEDPHVEAVTQWDFVDDAWLHAPAGAIREDNSLKPVYEMLDRLINEEYSTSVTIRTDEKGHLPLTGFLGLYKLSTDAGCAFVDLRAGQGGAAPHRVQLS